MTPDQLRALLNQCATLPDGRIEIDRSDMAELARDALRFRWLLARHGETEADPDSPNVWLHFIGWAREVRTADIRAAIDDGMGEAP